MRKGATLSSQTIFFAGIEKWHEYWEQEIVNLDTRLSEQGLSGGATMHLLIFDRSRCTGTATAPQYA